MENKKYKVSFVYGHVAKTVNKVDEESLKKVIEWFKNGEGMFSITATDKENKNIWTQETHISKPYFIDVEEDVF